MTFVARHVAKALPSVDQSTQLQLVTMVQNQTQAYAVQVEQVLEQSKPTSLDGLRAGKGRSGLRVGFGVYRV